MTLLSYSAVFNIVAFFVSFLVITIAYFKWKFSYWAKCDIKLSEEPIIPFGNARGLLTGQISFGEQFHDIYKKLKAKDVPYGGVYVGFKPFFMPIDLELVKRIMKNDFQHFVNHGTYIDDKQDPLSGHLFNLEDSKWRNMRAKLTPTFTSGKMKMMFQTLVDCTVGLREIMDNSAHSSEAVDIKDVLGRFTTDIIGSCAFGLECNSLKNPDAEFRKYGKKVFDTAGFWEQARVLLPFFLPHGLLKAVGFKPTKSDVEKFFMKAVADTVAYREKNNIYRKDFMHLLLQIKNLGKVTDDETIITENVEHSENSKLTLNEISAQAFVFFLAGFETSSTTMTFALYELAENPEIQKKLREEINKVLVKHDNQITYDSVNEMGYLENVLHETLRKHPALPVLFRKCNKDYVIPGTTTLIEEGTDVVIPALAIQRDPEYYPDPEKFDPDRFTDEAKSQRKSLAWIPFGEGPRICIGLRFGMLQSKIGLLTLLRNYEIKLSKKTPSPLKLDSSSFITTVEGGVWLEVKKLA